MASIAVLQVGLQYLAIAESGVHRRFEQAPAVLAKFLGLVEGKVRLDDHRVDVGVVGPRQHRARADLDAQRMAGDIDLALQALEHVVEHEAEFGFAVDPVDEHHELVAAEPADLDAVRCEAGQPFGNAVDQAVADRMAERVVDALEIVEVEHGQRAVAVMVAGGHHLADDLVEIGAVGQAGQIVVSAPSSGSSPPPRRAATHPRR